MRGVFMRSLRSVGNHTVQLLGEPMCCVSSSYNRGGVSMNTHVALLTALFSGVIAGSSSAARADQTDQDTTSQIAISTS